MYRDREFASLRGALNLLGFSGERSKLIRHYTIEVEAGTYSVSGSGQNVVLKVVRADGTIDVDTESRKIIENSISARNAARKSKDFKEADRIRDELAKMGVVLKDGPEGTTWEVAR
jgi:cysteinyl-tRNA synthetase